MENPNDPRNIIGMANILADDEEDIDDIKELEKSIINGVSFKKKDDRNVDIAKEYDQELRQLSAQFNIDAGKSSNLDDDDDYNFNKLSSNRSNVGNSSSVRISVDDYDANDDNGGGGNDNSGNDRGRDGGSGRDRDDDGGDEDGGDNDRGNYSSKYGSSGGGDGPHSSWSASRPLDSHLNQMTNEERKQKHINKVLGTMEKNDDDVNFIREEEEEDEIAKIMEQIDLLKTNLESEGVDLSRIPEINSGSTKKEAKAVLRILQIKNDRLRYCDMFEEAILAGAYGLESMFDGKKNWFGSQIDLTGWSDSVKVKLRRMRYDTSTFVSEVVKGYSIGSGWRILFELLPSLFLYSRDRRLRSNDNLISDEKYKDAVRDLGV
jgi:hypothetical protein